MSPRTLFLSKLIGLYCILVALSMKAQVRLRDRFGPARKQYLCTTSGSI